MIGRNLPEGGFFCGKNMKNLGKILILLLPLFLLLFTKATWAAVRCETQYGGGEVCVKTGELQIDKEVLNPQTSEFVDNLDITTYKFAPGEEITFKLKIKNVGDETFSKVWVKDSLPSYLEVVSGSLEFEITDLNPDETEEREIKVKVVSDDRFPKDLTICEDNLGEVWSDDERDKDTAQVCLSRKVLGITVQPKTGPDSGQAILLTSSILSLLGLSGIIFVKKIK